MTITVNDIKNENIRPDTSATGYTIDYSFLLPNKQWNGQFQDQSGVTKYVFDDSTAGTLTNQQYFESALFQWANYTVFSFSENDSNAELVIYGAETNENVPTPNDGGNKGGATFPTSFNNGVGYTNVEIVIDDDADLKSFEGYELALHEIGHVLGLKDIGTNNNYNTDITIMSYNVPDGRYAITPMALDILAVEEMYSAASNSQAC